MIIAVECAQHFFHFADRVQEGSKPLPLDHLLVAWLQSNGCENVDRLGGDYATFLQMVILVLIDPRSRSMVGNSPECGEVPALGSDIWVGTAFLARIGADVFKKAEWRSEHREQHVA